MLVLIIVPLTGILLVAWLLTKKKIIGKILGLIWVGIMGIIALAGAVHWLMAQKVLDKSDYRGTYVVDRAFFGGAQADWQYNSFRFEIKQNDSIYFYVTDRQKILKTYVGTITTTTSYKSHRLVLNMVQPTHHIIGSNPTTCRGRWSFYLVFHSSKFNNVFFRKGEWTPLKY